MERLLDEARAALTTLPPGPWTAYGTTVYAGSRVVAEVAAKGPQGEQTARTLAQLPDLIHLLVVVGPDSLMGRLQAQDAEIEQLKDRITDLEIDLDLARSEERNSGRTGDPQ
jgi:hypothetical protein